MRVCGRNVGNYRHLSLAGRRARHSDTGPLMEDEKMMTTRSIIQSVIVVVVVVVTAVAAVVLVVCLWVGGGWRAKSTTGISNSDACTLHPVTIRFSF